MTNNKQIITIIGLARSGKCTISKKYIKENSDSIFKTVSIADELRKAAWVSLGFIPKNYDNFKKRLLYLDECPDIVSTIVSKKFPNWITGRQYLQKFGNDFCCNHDEYIWLNKAINKMENSTENIIIDDVRKKYELVKIKEMCSKNNYEMKIIFTDYRSELYQDKDTHMSEALALWVRDNLNLKHGHIESVLTNDSLLSDSLANMYDKIICSYEGV